MSKYTELFSEYLESGGELPTAVVTRKCNETMKGDFNKHGLHYHIKTRSLLNNLVFTIGG